MQRCILCQKFIGYQSSETDTFFPSAVAACSTNSNYKERGETQHRYWTNECKNCPLKAQCTPGKERRVNRWENEAVLDEMQSRLDHFPEAMRIRRETVEHTFGTIKFWMGNQHFSMKTLKHVATEFSLHVLAYNMKRVMKIIGIVPLMQVMRA